MMNTTVVALAAASALARPRAVMTSPRAEAPASIDALNRAFEDFKAKHTDLVNAKASKEEIDAALAPINASMSAIEKTLDDQAKQIAAAKLGGGIDAVATPEEADYAVKFSAYFRKGIGEHEVEAAQKTGVRAALSEGSSADGGYFAPVEWDRTITSKLKRVSPIRQHASVQSISKAGFRKVYNDRSVGSGWVGETASRPATSTPQLAVLDFTPGEIYAFPFATQTLLEDSEVNIEQWLADEVETEFNRQEGIAFLSGDGVNKPFGLLTYVTGAANAAKHPWGAIPVKNSGAAAAFTPEGFISLFYDLPPEYRGDAKLYANTLSIGEMRKLKDGQNNFIWQPALQMGQPSNLAGVPVVEVADMPNVAAGNIAALYGDMAMTYQIVDRVGISVLRDALTNKPYVGFYTRKRVGGGVKNPEPMRALKISA